MCEAHKACEEEDTQTVYSHTLTYNEVAKQHNFSDITQANYIGTAHSKNETD